MVDTWAQTSYYHYFKVTMDYLKKAMLVGAGVGAAVVAGPALVAGAAVGAAGAVAVGAGGAAVGGVVGLLTAGQYQFYYPAAPKAIQGIVFTHGIQMGGRVVRQWEKVCPGCISETIRCRKLILGIDIG